MARCWSCGAEIPGGLRPRYWYTCPNCAQVEELESLRKEASSNLTKLVAIQQHGFETLSDRLSEVATVIEWGFEEVKWELQQQTDVLRSIDHTLRTPSETEANEWREIAEELRNRGVLGQSEQFFLKAVEANPLDYRIYIGLAETYLRMEKFNKAETFLERSLTHAPLETKRNLEESTYKFLPDEEGEEFKAWLNKEEYHSKISYNTYSLPFDYKSYSYRLLGRIYFCQEDYQQAASVLQKSIELSPSYWEGHYDHAQYYALVGKKEGCFTSLQKAILGNPFYFHLAAKEKNFTLVRAEVDNLLRGLNTQTSEQAKEIISLAGRELRKAEEAVSAAREALQPCKKSIAQANLPEYLDRYIHLYEEARQKFCTAGRQMSSGSYVELVQAKETALRAEEQAIEAKRGADEERDRYEKAYSGVKKEKRENRELALFWGLISIGMIGGGVALWHASGIMSPLWGTLMIIGGVIGLIISIFGALG